MAEVGNLLEKITDPMVIIIRVVGSMAECFWFLREFIGFLYFFRVSTYDPISLHVKTPKKPPISNSKMLAVPKSR